MSAPMSQGQPYAGQQVPPSKGRWFTTKWFIGAAALLVGVGIGSAGGGDEPAGSAAPAPMTTVTVTSQPVEVEKDTATEPQLATTAPAEQGSLAARVDQTIKDNSAGQTPTWALPITKIEDVSSGTIRVYYQEPLTKDEAKTVGQRIFTFTSTGVDDLRTIVVQDASGIDHNVFK